MNKWISMAFGAAMVAGLWTATAVAQDNSTQLQRNLDKPVKLEVTDLPIGEVFDKLSKESGVKFILDPDTLVYLPYGNQTRLAVTLKNITLRNALTPMLAPQALQWSPEGDAIRISPSEALYRIGRRATYDELQVLGKICSTQLTAGARTEIAEQVKDLMTQLQTATGNKELSLNFQTAADKRDTAYARSIKALPCTGAAWLDALCNSEWTWYLYGDEVIILDRKKQVERQLGRMVSLRYQNEQLTTVLLDLAKQGRVQLAMDPGVIQLLPADTRNNFNLIMADVPISQALEVISGATGLNFARTAEGIRVEPGKLTATATPAATTRPSFYIRVQLPESTGLKGEMMIRSDDLPEDLKAALESVKAKYIADLRAKMVKTPASKPADNSEPGFEGQ